MAFDPSSAKPVNQAPSTGGGFDLSSARPEGQAPAQAPAPVVEQGGPALNPLRNLGGRLADIAGNFVELGGNIAAPLTDAITGTPGESPGIFIDSPEAMREAGYEPDYSLGGLGVYFGPVRSEDAITGKSAGRALEGVDFGYEPVHTIDKAIDDPSLATVGGAIVEQGPAALSDMAALFLNTPAYLASRTQEMADTRAANNNREGEVPTAEDYLYGGAGAGASVALDKLALGRLLPGGAGTPVTSLAQVPGAAARAAATEAGTEAIQEGGIEYAAETLGTEAGYDLNTALRRAVGGAILGGALGGGVRGVTSVVELRQGIRKSLQDQGVDDSQVTDADIDDILRRVELASQDQQLTPEMLDEILAQVTGTDRPGPLGEGQAPEQAAQARRQRESELGALFEGTDVNRREDLDVDADAQEATLREGAQPVRDATGRQASPETFGSVQAAATLAKDMGLDLRISDLEKAAAEIQANPDADPREIVQSYDPAGVAAAFDAADVQRRRQGEYQAQREEKEREFESLPEQEQERIRREYAARGIDPDQVANTFNRAARSEDMRDVGDMREDRRQEFVQEAFDKADVQRRRGPEYREQRQAKVQEFESLPEQEQARIRREYAAQGVDPDQVANTFNRAARSEDMRDVGDMRADQGRERTQQAAQPAFDIAAARRARREQALDEGYLGRDFRAGANRPEMQEGVAPEDPQNPWVPDHQGLQGAVDEGRITINEAERLMDLRLYIDQGIMSEAEGTARARQILFPNEAPTMRQRQELNESSREVPQGVNEGQPGQPRNSVDRISSTSIGGRQGDFIPGNRPQQGPTEPGPAPERDVTPMGTGIEDQGAAPADFQQPAPPRDPQLPSPEGQAPAAAEPQAAPAQEAAPEQTTDRREAGTESRAPERKPAQPVEFHKAISEAQRANPNGASVHVYPVSEYEGMQLFLYDDGRAGFAITPSGGLVSVFKHPNSTMSGALDTMVPEAISQGATTLDAFEGFLTESYAKHGFKEVDRLPWDPQYAPDGWDTQTMGEPDVVIMEVANESVQPQRPADSQPVQQPEGVRSGAQEVQGAAEQRGGDRGRREAGGSEAPLPGAPTVEGASGPDPKLNSVAQDYARQAGIDLTRQEQYVEVDVDRAERIAQAYADMEHNPSDPAVQAAYQDLIEQTTAQYQALVDAGYEFYFFDETNDPYDGNPWNAMRELRGDQRMGVFATESGFGSGDTDLDVADNPLLQDTGLEWPYGGPDGPMKRVTANDLFRAVHDAFGHGLEGAGFRARGEENAWQAHARLFTGPALGALTSETRGQNSWLNYGPHGETNRTAGVEDTIFADQKTGLMPEWTWTEGLSGAEAAPQQLSNANPEQDLSSWFGNSVVTDENGDPLVVYRGEHGYIGDKSAGATGATGRTAPSVPRTGSEPSREEIGFGPSFQTRLPSLSFGSKKAAELYSRSPNNRADTVQQPRVMAAYLRIENPIVNDPDDPFIDLRTIEEKLGREEAERIGLEYEDRVDNTDNWDRLSRELGVGSVEELMQKYPDRLGDVYLDVYPVLDDPVFVRKARAAGFDGAVTDGAGETALDTEYRVFSPEQVRLVDEPGAGPNGGGGKPKGPKLYTQAYGGIPLDALVDAIKRVIGGEASAFRYTAEQIGELIGHMKEATGGITGKNRPSQRSLLADMWRVTFATMDGDLRMLGGKFNSPTLKGLADKFHALAGADTGTEQTFDEATQARNKRLQAVDQIVSLMRDAGINKPEQRRQIIRLVENPRTPRRGVVGEVANRIEKFLKEELKYLRDAGVDVGEVRDGYFPREMDLGKVTTKADVFRAQATKAYQEMGLPLEQAQEAARAYYESTVYGSSGKPGDIRPASQTPKFTQSRVFTKKAAEHLRQFMLDDIDAVLGQYTMRATKRAEIARRFGDNWSEWDAMEKQMIAEDPKVQEILPAIRDRVALSAGVRLDSVSQSARAAMSLLRTFTTLATLPKSAMASLGELVMAPIRGTTGNIPGDVANTVMNLLGHGINFASMTTGMGRTEAMKAAFEMAEDIGIIAGTGHNSLMAARFAGGDPVGKAQSTVLSEFFKRNLLEHLTNYTRVTTMRNGQVFLRRLAHQMEGNPKRTGVFLRELGVPRGKEEAFAQWVRDMGPDLPGIADVRGQFGGVYRNALQRFSDQTVMRPSASTRPKWASHPLGALLFQLQAFGYAFQKNVINRSFRVAANKELDALDKLAFSLSTLSGFALLTVAQGIVRWARDEIYNPEVNDRKTDWAFVEGALSQAGLFGVADPYLQSLSGVRYQKNPAQILLGPALGGVTDASGDLLAAMLANSPNTNTAERNFAKAGYDWLLEPLMQTALTAVPGGPVTGPLRSAATVYGVPAGRDPFADAVAGPGKPGQNPPIQGALEFLLNGGTASGGDRSSGRETGRGGREGGRESGR